MVLIVLDQIQADPVAGLISLAAFCFALLIGFTVHEFSHALSANQLGDPTPRRQGRLSLHPRAHLDPVGTALILLAGFGWAKPVPITPEYLRIGARSGMAVVALAGPLSNIAIAAVAAIPINAGLARADCLGLRCGLDGGPAELAGFVLASMVFWNLLLAAFNLVPLVPLDGFKVAVGVLPREAALQFARLERYGPAPLLAIIMLGFFVPELNLFGTVVRPMIGVLSDLVVW